MIAKERKNFKEKFGEKTGLSNRSFYVIARERRHPLCGYHDILRDRRDPLAGERRG
jgi:hypothetical protein